MMLRLMIDYGYWARERIKRSNNELELFLSECGYKYSLTELKEYDRKIGPQLYFEYKKSLIKYINYRKNEIFELWEVS